MPHDLETFDTLDRVLQERGVDAALAWLADCLRGEGNYHQLFDARLMQARQRLRLPVVAAASLHELPEPVRTALEDAYVEACRETGSLFLAAGRLREAWMYLCAAGEGQLVADHLAQLDPSPEEIDDVVQVALHEGVDPTLGYRLVLSHFGTCNAITMFDSVAHGRPKAERQSLAALLVRHVHQELLSSVRADIERREGAPPPVATIAELVRAAPGAVCRFELSSRRFSSRSDRARRPPDRRF